MSTTPTTTLEAVNELLTSVGNAPVNTLNAPGNSDIAIASDTIESISREVQTRGWWFNSTSYVSLAPANNEITVPANLIALRPSRGTNSSPPETRNFVIRAGKLYDPLTGSSAFTSAVRADAIYLLDFTDMPESARRYVTVRAARIFQTKVLGDESLGVFNEAHEQEAWQILEGDHGVSAPHADLFMQRVRRMSRLSRPDPVTSAEAGGRNGRQR